MTATAPAVAGVARWDQVLTVGVVPVVIEVIDNKGIEICGIGSFPSDDQAAPMARMAARPYRVVEDNAVHVSSAVREGQRVAREFAHSVSLRIKVAHRGVRRPSLLLATIVELAKTVLRVRSGAVRRRASIGPPAKVQVSVPVESPPMHLAQAASALIRLGTSFHGAPDRSLWPLKPPERIAVPSVANPVSLAEAMRVVLVLAPLNVADPHGFILRAGCTECYS